MCDIMFLGYVPTEENALIYRVDERFITDEFNPVTKGAYDDSWIAYCLTNSHEYQMLNGGAGKPLYVLSVSKNYPEWRMSVMDFIGYNESRNKNIILSISEEDLNVATEFYGEHSYNEKQLRSYEPKYLIHSTTQENWESIKNDGCLKSWNLLKGEKSDWEDQPIGKKLGDPNDFSDYIMFSRGNVSSEIVVLSKQKGCITMNQNMKYRPGVRLYFDMEKIALDGLLIRDGCHLKVKDTLPLEGYLAWIGDWKSVGLLDNVSTPKEFTLLANEKFNQLFNASVETTF